MKRPQQTIALAAALLLSVVTTGCNDDCDTFCGNQAAFIEECLPQFEQEWTDVADGSWTNASDFQGACREGIDEELARQVEETCTTEETAEECETTLSRGIIGSCSDHIADFQVSCSDFWRTTTNFTPGAFDPERPEPEGDDDDSAGDDDDSASDDDDSASDDDDSAGDDDDAADDDDSATDDDDAADDDDSATDDDDAADDDDSATDDDDSATDDDDAADDDDSATDDDDAADDDDSATDDDDAADDDDSAATDDDDSAAADDDDSAD